MNSATPRTMKKEAYLALVGHEIGTSSWLLIDQPLIDRFADLTADHQFIHVDPVRAKAEGPFGGTVAHGFLTLSMLSRMAYEVMPEIEGVVSGINYGFDRIRFLAPVRSGARIRARFTLIEAHMKTPRELVSKTGVSVEVEGAPKPALAAEWLSIRVFAK